jgi:aryl-alcohol dehydrogenase-like predicted oxidoreductase
MRSGLLTGRFSADRVASLPEDDWRRNAPDFLEPELSRNLALVAGLGVIAADMGVTLPELAVAWTLAWPAVDGSIVGARTSAQVDGWIGAVDVALGDDELSRFADEIDRCRAGTGPLSPVVTT